MNQADYSDDFLVQKYEFLDKYDKLSTPIRQHLPCYMIAADWWLTFEYFIGLARDDAEQILGDSGPINNIPLLQLDSSYKLLAAPRLSNEQVNTSALPEMKDWDRMSIRKDLKYREDFFIVSGNVWRFLKNKYGGGPEIELFPEARAEKPETYVSLVLSSDDEPLIEKNTVVSFDLIRVYVIKEGESSSRFSKYISKTITINNLLTPLCSKLSLSLSNSLISYTNPGSKPIEIKNRNSTLLNIGIKEGTIINICQRPENLLAEIFIPTYLDFLKKDDEENSSKTDDNLLSASTKDDGFNVIKFNSFEFDFPNRESDPAKFSTGTSNPNQNAFYDDPIFGNGNHLDQRPEIYVNFERENFPDLGTFLEKAKDSMGKQPVSFGFKSIKQIRNDVDDMLQEWNFKSNHFSKKI